MLDDIHYMRRCIALARQAAGRTSPNPLVGAIVTDDNGAIIAEGFHSRAGEPHAEIEALNKAGSAALGNTLYVNLEPCCHFGRTGPCSQKVIDSGVKRVICGMQDPNPQVAGGGIRALREAGIEVLSGVAEDECRYLNRGFIKWVQKRRPWLALKMACTLDGRIADRDGQSRWITGDDARSFVHELRNEYDAVMIGSNTAAADNPSLTVRELSNSRDPYRIIIDSALSLTPVSQLAKNPDGKTIVFALKTAIAQKQAQFTSSVQLIEIPASQQQKPHVDLDIALSRLATMNLLSILCEGGAGLAAALMELRLVDEIYWFVAPRFLVDGQAKSVMSGRQPVAMAEAINLGHATFQQLGKDLLIHGLLTTP